MSEYRTKLELFARGAQALKCVSSHYLPDRSGRCDLTSLKDQEEIFVLANRSNNTLKVGPKGMQIVANVLDIQGADHWYEHLKEQRKAEKERLAKDQARRAAESTQSKVVILKKSPKISRP